jgi:hypothetical protein
MLDEKAIFGPRQIRTTDPDVYTSPDSARVRSRQLGCIGIRRYATIDGGEAWMPCTNESDFRRSMGKGPQAKKDRDKKEREFIKRVIKKTNKIQAAKPNSRIVSKMIDTKSVEKEDNRFIVSKVRNHNKDMELAGKGKEYMASVGVLSSIWDKEKGNGSKAAMRRVNLFLSVLAGASPKNLKYISDISMLADGHPRKIGAKVTRHTF